MLWVVRAGKGAKYYKKFIEAQRIYLPWDGYNRDLSDRKSLVSFREVVQAEKGTDNRTTISNWSAQLYAFVDEMQIGDLVLIPSERSRSYALAEITGGYTYSNGAECLSHYRAIRILKNDIPRKIFSQSVVYSLGAFRTIFKARYEDEIMKVIEKWNG